MVQRLRLSFFLILSLALVTPAAWSGAVIEGQVKSTKTGKIKSTVVYYLEPGRLRAESEEKGRPSIMIFRADRQLVWMIEPDKKSYTELTQADMAGQMEAMLKDAPPEERAMMEQMMKGRMGAAKPATITVKRLGTEPVGKYTCTKYEVRRDGKLSMEVWAAPLAEVNLQPADFDTFVQFSRFMEKLAQAVSQMAGSTEALPTQPEGIEGFPVKMLRYVKEQPFEEHNTTRAERQTIGDDKFQPPPGFRKEKMESAEP